VRGVVEEAQEILYSKLMKVDIDAKKQVDPQQVPAIHWDSMVDNPSESRVGWSFLDDERNKFDVDGEWWMYERMYKEQRLREEFIESAGKQGVAVAVAVVMTVVDKVQGKYRKKQQMHINGTLSDSKSCC